MAQAKIPGHRGDWRTLAFQGYGEYKKARHLQSSASLLFSVFAEYEPQNLLLRQSYRSI
jgi:ATP-dependent Lhr-like helicase